MQVSFNLNLPPVHAAGGYNFLWDYLLERAQGSHPEGVDPRSAGFLTFCLQHSPKSKGQMMQDLYVLFRLPKTNGFFVEFGATNGLTINNTYLLETTMSWSGVVAEPFPVWHDALRSNRKCKVETRCVWSKTSEDLDFVAFTETPELATLNNFVHADHHDTKRLTNSSIFRVQTISLNDLLAESGAPKHLDYLSVDTEGSEFEILQSLDTARWLARIITVEHNYVQEARNRIHHLLSRWGYVREFEAFSK
jgi:FkbM family methyltransferase